MKALHLYAKMIILCLLIGIAACAVCCRPIPAEVSSASITNAETEEDESDSSQMITVPMYSSNGAKWEERFTLVYGTEHTVAYVSAHAIDDGSVCELVNAFESRIYPVLPVPTIYEGKRLCILLSVLEGNVYGYMPSEWQEQGPTVCINALYADDLEYALAHEYQHLCVYEACKSGKTELSEDIDELLSDMFCELLFPEQGRQRGILSEERAKAARSRIDSWGKDGLLHVYELLREGYSENEMLMAMEQWEKK